MAMATSAPELFVSCIGTFITEGDVGVGTIVGSANFNILAVPACVGLFTRTAVQLEWWSVTRDCLFYGLSVIGFIIVIFDSRVMWYEAVFLCVAYGVYLLGK
jgi:Ca2+/Na+ antiporter